MANYFRAFSMEYGTFVGLCWSALFLSYVYGMTAPSGLLLMLCFALGVVSLVLPFALAVRLNRMMRSDGVSASYLQGLLFSFSMMMYACLLHGIVVFAYFELLDHGALFSTLCNMLGDSAISSIYEQMGMATQYNEVVRLMAEVSEFGSFDKALMMFNNDFMWSVLLVFLLAIPISWKRK